MSRLHTPQHPEDFGLVQHMTLLERFSRLPARNPKVMMASGIVLFGLITIDAVFLERLPSAELVIAIGSSIVCSLCAIPGTPVPLAVRGSIAVVVSWGVTLYFLAGTDEIGVWGIGEIAALLLLLCSVCWRASDRTATILAPAIALACMAVPTRDANPQEWTLAISLITLIVATFSLLLRAQRQRRFRDLAETRSVERRALARELHDVVAHHITGIVVQAKAIRFVGPQGRIPDDALERIETEAAEALNAMKRLVAVMRRAGDHEQSGPLAPTGLGDLPQMARDFARTGPPVKLDIAPGVEARLPADVRAGIHRIVREALTNIRKHAADAALVRISLRELPTGIELKVINDGHRAAGLPPRARGGGFGLEGMRERAAAMAGRLDAGPTDEGGWQVQALLPLGPPGN